MTSPRISPKHINDNDEDGATHIDDDEEENDWLTKVEIHIHIKENIEEIDFYDVDGRTNSEIQFIFIRDLFDGIHCHILHQYDYGYRIHKDEIEKNMMNVDQNKVNAFAILTKIIEEKRIF